MDLTTLYKDVAHHYVHQCSVPEQSRHLIDRAMRIAQGERTVTSVIFPNDVQEMEIEDPILPICPSYQVLKEGKLTTHGQQSHPDAPHDPHPRKRQPAREGCPGKRDSSAWGPPSWALLPMRG